MGKLIASVKGWASEPFAKPMNIGQYALVVGLTIILVFLWSRVLSHITAEL